MTHTGTWIGQALADELARLNDHHGWSREDFDKEWNETTNAAPDVPTHRAYALRSTLTCACVEYGRDHVARRDIYDAH